MKSRKIIDPISIVIGIAFFLLSFFIFFRDSGLLADSIMAALIASGLVWATYIILRICILAAKRKDD